MGKYEGLNIDPHQKGEIMELKIQEHGTMLSDYFSGTSGVMLPISIDKHTTCQEVLSMLKDEIDLIWEHAMMYTAEYHKYPLDKLKKEIENQLSEMKIYVMANDKMNKAFNPDLDFAFNKINEDDFNDLPVAIFTIEFI